MLIRCEMLKKLANAFIEVAKEENLPVNITMGRSYTDSGGSRQVGIILEFDSWNSKIINDKLADTINRILRTRINMNQMNIELSKMQLIHLRNICKKGWVGQKPSDDLEEMVKNGLLTKSARPFGDVVYRPTDAGRSYINDFNNEQK